MIKWILFDIAGVIVKMNFVDQDKIIVGSKKYHPKLFDPLYYGEIYSDFMRGHATEEEVILNFLEKQKLDCSVQEVQEMLRNNVRAVPGMLELLSELKKSYNLIGATNEGREWTQNKIDGLNLGEYFLEIIESNKIHELKPSAAFYEKVLKEIGAKAEESIFIDDREKNCIGAQAIGIRSIHFKDCEQLKKELEKIK